MVDYLLINHKFHDEFRLTEGPFPEDKKASSTATRLLAHKKVTSHVQGKKSEPAKVLKTKDSFTNKVSVSKAKNPVKTKPSGKLLPSKQFEFDKVEK